MADHTAGTAATTVVGEGEYVLSAGFNLSLLRPATGEKLRCRAAVLKPGRRLVVVESDVYAVSNSGMVLVSKATVTLAVLKTQDGDAPHS
jgi:acyl-coenzyme A thioesterase PaaI-like protein